MYNLGDDDRELVTELRNDSDLFRESQDEGESEVDQIYSAESSICGDRPEENECDPNEMSDDDGITFTEDDDDNLKTCVIDMDTMLDDYEPIIPQLDEPLIPQELTFAPGEGQIPVSVFKDENAEYLAFPTIFCGQKRPDNCNQIHKVHYSDICKYELRCVDRRVAFNVPNLFFKVKRLQIKQVCGKVTLALQCFKTKGKKLKVKDILDDTERQKLINLDEGYYIFRTIRNSPAYLEKRKKDAFAMFRQLGTPITIHLSVMC